MTLPMDWTWFSGLALAGPFDLHHMVVFPFPFATLHEITAGKFHGKKKGGETWALDCFHDVLWKVFMFFFGRA